MSTSRTVGAALALAVVASTLSVAPSPADAAPSPSGSAPVSVLVHHDDRAASTLTALAAEPLLDRVSVVRTPREAVGSVIDALRATAGVQEVSPDLGVNAATDPLRGDQWGLQNLGGTLGIRPAVADVDLALGDAVDFGARADDVVVAVLDTSVDLDHEDLADALWTNEGEIPDNGIDDDGNGFVDDVHGWDFRDDQPLVPATTVRHGTHVAGTVAAVTGNGVGIQGAAPGVRLMPLRVLSDDGMGDVVDVVEALAYARDHGADLVNASWGGPGNRAVLRAAIVDSGLPVVAAAGNSTGCDDLDLCPIYPAALDLDVVLSVGSIDPDGRLSRFSKYGDVAVDVGAPGYRIVSTVPNGYGYLDGTSMAAPQVSGVLALALARGLVGAAAVDAVIDTVRPIGALDGLVATGGIPDALALSMRLLPSRACPGDTTPRGRFADVAASNVHARGIDCSAHWGLVQGKSSTRYAPDDSITRGQFASILARVLRRTGVTASGVDHFSDDDASVHEASIDLLADHDIVRGDGSGAYRPDRTITRAQAASIVVRLFDVIGGRATVGTDRFTDDDGSVHEASIERLAELAVLSGTGPRTYRPQRSITRAQTATVVARLLEHAVVQGRLTPP